MRAHYIPVAVLLVSFAAAAADQPPKPPKPPKPPPAPKAHPNAAPGGNPSAPKRASDDQVEKLAKMTPAQREKALSGLPPDQRARLEARLDQWNKLTPQQKARVEMLRNLPPQTVKRIRELSDKIKALPDDRKRAVRKEIAHLQNLSPDQRQKRLNSPEVKKDFSPQEQEILRESPNLLPQNYF